MIKIVLYKNNKIVLEKEGKIQENLIFFDNIIYDLNAETLIREDANFKFYLDFLNEKSEVTIKENDYLLNLQIKVIKKNITNNKHEIYYNIESENVIENCIVITF